MCGITGILAINGTEVPFHIIKQMTKTMVHRGPDDEGYVFFHHSQPIAWHFGGNSTPPQVYAAPLRFTPSQSFNGQVSSDVMAALGHRRLAILDLSPAGHQPMCTEDGRFWIVYNGEIYNFKELRQTLISLGEQFFSDTDTEVVLKAYRYWGVEALSRFNGMWALAIWDNQQKEIFCARDRFGIKPFYYTFDGHRFAFASEIKALLQLPDIQRQPNDAIIYDYLNSGLQDHSNETFFTNIYQLQPAHYLIVKQNQIKLNRYWDLDPQRKLEFANDDAYTKAFYELFEDTVRLHLRSDVPIGTCLSGGLDSSSIVCVANKLLFTEKILKLDLVGQQQKTFSACAEDLRFDERAWIVPVLQATGAEANYTFPDVGKLLQDLPHLIWHQDEPFGSTSIFAQWCVMEIVAHRKVKVLLDGQGGDELLAGYHSYFMMFWRSLAAQRKWRKLWQEISSYHRLFGLLTRSNLMTLGRLTPPALRSIGKSVVKNTHPFRLTDLILNPNFAQMFRDRRYYPEMRSGDMFQDYLYHSLTRSSLPALLHYEDRNSMAYSIEARVPFLDYRLVEFVSAIPAEQKIQQGLTKAILRHSLQGILPESVRLRSDKMGFVTPQQNWLSNDLNDWMQDIFNSITFRQRKYFDSSRILAALKDHNKSKKDLLFVAWRLINLELWLRQMIDRKL